MISVIIPVYNAAPYLEAAVKSVISQTYNDWEMILIDDGSTDGSAALCDTIAVQYSRLRVIHKENGGQSSARNAGLKMAGGEFIFFLDADDLLPTDALELLFRAQSSANADCVCGMMENFNDSQKPFIKSRRGVHEVLSPVKATETVLYQRGIDNSMCGKLFARKLFDDVSFTDGIYYEDLDIFYRIFLLSNKIAFIPEVVYFYRQHPASYIHTFNLRRKDMLEVTARLEEFMAANRPELLRAARSRRLSANFNMLMLLAANGKALLGDQKSEADILSRQCWEKIKELRGNLLTDRKVRLKNKLGIMISYCGSKKLLESLGKIFY